MNENGLLPIALDAVILECRDAAALADFYTRLSAGRKIMWKKTSGRILFLRQAA